MTTTTLRPMSTGQVLDRTFNLYRRNFVLFFGIAMLPPALMLLIQLLPLAVTPLAQAGSSFAAGLAVAAFAGMIVFFFVWLMGYAVAQAATVYAVSAAHLGRPITISQSYGKVRGRYLRILGLIFLIFLIGAGSAVLIVAAGSSVSIFAGPRSGAGAAGGAIAAIAMAVSVILAIIFAVFFFLRYAVAVPACALEDLRILAALRRSVHLTKKDRGRIFVIYFLVGVLNYIVMLALIFPAAMVGTAIAGAQSVVGQIFTLIAQFLAGALIGPVATIAMSLVYYDERVRKEAFDLQLMMASIDKPLAGAASTI
jgi:MFS family permease